MLLDDKLRGPSSIHQELLNDLQSSETIVKLHKNQNEILWIFQNALELSYQNSISKAILDSSAPIPKTKSKQNVPSAHVYFCIDVRSEPIRRAIESQDDSILTSGFAGFFGLPLDYNPIGTNVTSPQLPGLLSAQFHGTDSCQNEMELSHMKTARRETLDRHAQWKGFQVLPSSAFTFVEIAGIFSGFKLIKSTFPSYKSAKPWANAGLKNRDLKKLKPKLINSNNDLSFPLISKIALCHKILRAMSCTKNFAPLIFLLGHGSQSANNALGRSLDCGACCGQTGEVNARILAQLLNENGVREGLKAEGINIPPSTHFVAGLHYTTTDKITLFDIESIASSHVDPLNRFEKLLEKASHMCRVERSQKLGMTPQEKPANFLQKIFFARANDWSELQPEWGLANNAAFIVAPRSLTKGINLEGRCFLHDYEETADTDWKVLELIMTAPMIVTHWINMQYFASTTDNVRYGSGNKTLHNVVGGNIGVFEGNGGDLRFGLSHQSLWRESRLMHTPLRLSVFIEASHEAIETIVSKHAILKNLLQNRWIFLLRICSKSNSIMEFPMAQNFGSTR